LGSFPQEEEKNLLKIKEKQLAQTEKGKTTTASGILTMRSIWDSAQLYIVRPYTIKLE
jgi:hypothetical protein